MRQYVKYIKEPKMKLTVLRLEIGEDCRIKYFSVDGDFFALNPEALDKLPQMVNGRHLSNELITDIVKALKEAEIVGSDVTIIKRELENLVKEAMNSCADL